MYFLRHMDAGAGGKNSVCTTCYCCSIYPRLKFQQLQLPKFNVITAYPHNFLSIFWRNNDKSVTTGFVNTLFFFFFFKEGILKGPLILNTKLFWRQRQLLLPDRGCELTISAKSRE